MKKNRKKSKKMSVLTTRSLYVGAVIFSLFVAVIIDMLAESTCTQLTKAIGEKEKQLVRLEADRDRESARWETMLSGQNLDMMLMRHGLSMHYPRAEQCVRVNADGRPYASALALANARRSEASVVGRNDRAPRRRSGVVRR